MEMCLVGDLTLGVGGFNLLGILFYLMIHVSMALGFSPVYIYVFFQVILLAFRSPF
jgi:hypothetical protein